MPRGADLAAWQARLLARVEEADLGTYFAIVLPRAGGGDQVEYYSHAYT